MKSKLLTIAVTRFYEPILEKLAKEYKTKAKAIRTSLAMEYKRLWPQEYKALCEAEKKRLLDKMDLNFIDDISGDEI